MLTLGYLQQIAKKSKPSLGYQESVRKNIAAGSANWHHAC
jgi:hypothetical protein